MPVPSSTSRHSRNTVLRRFSSNDLIQYVLLSVLPIVLRFADTFVPAHSIMARMVMPSLTPHYANNSPWSVSVNLTFGQAEDFLRQFFSAVMYHLHTAILFTWTDYKTIFLPIVSIFVSPFPLAPSSNALLRRLPSHVRLHPYSRSPACYNAGYGFGSTYSYATCPTKPAAVKRISSIALGVPSLQDESPRPRPSPSAGPSSFFVYFGHQFTIKISSGRRWASWPPHSYTTNSARPATSSAKTSVTLVVTLLSKLVLRPSLVCACANFDWRMLTGLGAKHAMDYVSVTAVIISGMLIFTTIQAQDFPDVEGDKALGRMTFPIYAPEFSRVFTLVATIVWSMFLSWFWEVGPISTAFLVCFGTYIGMRYYLWRTLEADKKSYLIFNVRP